MSSAWGRSLAAAAFMVRDGGMPGSSIAILEAAPLMGGSLDGAGDAEHGYSLRGGRMLTTDTYECTWDLYRSIPSLQHAGKSVFEETVDFNELHQASSMARLVDRRRARVPVTCVAAAHPRGAAPAPRVRARHVDGLFDVRPHGVAEAHQRR